MLVYKAAISKLQQLIRGINGRIKILNIIRTQHESTIQSLRNYYVANIQRLFRAWYSRKYRYSHYRRQQYVALIQQRGKEVLDMMNEYALEQQRQLKEEEDLKKKEDFEKLAGRLHHLVSTQTIRGVFNPSPQYVQPPMAYDHLVEDQINDISREKVKQRSRHVGLLPNINGTLKVPLKGLKNKLSLQVVYILYHRYPRHLTNIIRL